MDFEANKAIESHKAESHESQLRRPEPELERESQESQTLASKAYRKPFEHQSASLLWFTLTSEGGSSSWVRERNEKTNLKTEGPRPQVIGQGG
jgi:hypothetical protein